MKDEQLIFRVSKFFEVLFSNPILYFAKENNFAVLLSGCLCDPDHCFMVTPDLPASGLNL